MKVRGGAKPGVRPVSLRLRLILGMLALVGVGLSASGVATYVQMQRLVVGRVATAVVATAHAAAAVLTAAGASASTESGRRDVARDLQSLLDNDELLAWLPDGTREPLVLSTGLAGPPVRDDLVHNVLGGYLNSDATQLSPPADLPLPEVHSVDHVDFQVASEQTALGPVVVAASMADADHLIWTLLLTEAGVGMLLLLVLAGAGVFVVRHGLRPLDTIVATAVAITAGERDQRVPLAPGSTEVGRVAAALNQMLDETEASYAEARAAASRLRRFVADASHELRTPLASVRSYAEILRSGAARTPVDRELATQRIESEAARMSELVEDLLLLARLDAGRPLRAEPVDLATLVRETVNDENTVDPHRPRQIVVRGDTHVIGDPSRLRQVVTNMLGNARIHTPPGTRVAVDLSGPEPADEPGRTVWLIVADEGPGLAADELEQVFERFYRGDPARTRHAGSGTGTGLGLSIVAAIVTAHGGTIRAQQGPDGGTSFIVSLPAAPAADTRG